jgi:hypothetical protein
LQCEFVTVAIAADAALDQAVNVKSDARNDGSRTRVAAARMRLPEQPHG